VKEGGKGGCRAAAAAGAVVVAEGRGVLRVLAAAAASRDREREQGQGQRHIQSQHWEPHPTSESEATLGGRGSASECSQRLQQAETEEEGAGEEAYTESADWGAHPKSIEGGSTSGGTHPWNIPIQGPEGTPRGYTQVWGHTERTPKAHRTHLGGGE